jgi:fimbrial chaperone protein
VKTYIRSVFFLALFLTIFVQDARADLLISPLRVVFEGRERSKVVNVVNNSDKTRTYRVEWVEKQIDENGNYTDIQPDANYIGASNLLRYSPRQITLAPGEKQAIRMALRKPGDLKDGEYRSHILFKQLANIEDEQAQASGPAIKLFVNVSISIPVVIRHGDTAINASLKSIQLTKNEENEDGFQVRLNRESGNVSAYGTVSVYDPQDTNRLKPLALLNNVALYTEVDHRNIFIPLENPLPTNLKQVLVVYEGRDEYDNKDFAQQLYTLP